MTTIRKINRALISVSNKEGLLEFARVLTQFGIEILSSGGTATFLKNHDISVIEISDYTGFPEMMAGRVKTLHPKIHGGILGRRGTDDEVMKDHHIDPIDLVIVNLYPFETVIKDPNCTREHAIENVDVGGPTLIRAAAKNHQDITVVVDPTDYASICEALSRPENGIDFSLRFELAKKAFARTAAYDAAIANYLYCEDKNDCFPEVYLPCFYKKATLRYGENPQQSAAMYVDPTTNIHALPTAKKIQGKALSFNNLADADAALICVKSFEQPACVIVKHANPCGVGVDTTILAAYQKAFSTDPKSAFGGIIAFNQLLDAGTLQTILEQQFVEVIIAPQIETQALAVAKQKPNVRILLYGENYQAKTPENSHVFQYKAIQGGLLVQTIDNAILDPSTLQFATKRLANSEELKNLIFAWTVVKFVKSNAIVLAKQQQTIGIGAGQMSRIDSATIALKKANDSELMGEDVMMASDAFFPFRDVVDLAAQNGIRAIIQPGGSLRDAEIIQAADEAGIAMVFTGIRHFAH